MITKYLKMLAVLLNVPAKNLTLEREPWATIPPRKYDIITDENFGGYTKPDQGYGSILHTFRVMHLATEVTRFGLYEFPSCCAFVVSTQAYVTPSYRGKGVNQLTNQLRQDLAKYHGYSAIVCTDVNSNVPQRRTLVNNGWRDVYQTVNKRTGNVVNISVKELK